MKEKIIYLVQNAGLLFIGNFSSKILVFFLVPIYTNALSTEEYGYYDLYFSTIQLLMPILTLNICDAVMRFSIKAKKEVQKSTFTIGIKYVFISIFIFSLGTIILNCIVATKLLNNYSLAFVLLFSSFSLHQLIVQFARGLNDISGLSITGFITTIIMIVLNLIFLVWMKLGLNGYFYANIISWSIASIILFIRNKMYCYIGKISEVFYHNSFEKGMLFYCCPLIINSLSWNINNMSDRYTVSFFCGVAINGIYSVAYKIPSILNAFQTIFIQAWQLSAIQENHSKDRDDFYSLIYSWVQFVMVLMCSTLIIFSRFLAQLIFAKDFYIAWIYVPTLLIYTVFNTLSGTVGAVFSAEKDTPAIAKTALVGALTNVVLNILLVYKYGAEGAAIATVISSIIIWTLRMIGVRKYIHLKINYKKCFLTFFILATQAFFMTIYNGYGIYSIQFFLWCIIVIINFNFIRRIKRYVLETIKK